MINTAIQHVVAELNSYFDLRSGASTAGHVVAGSLFDLDGNINTATKDKVVLSMVNIEQDAVYKPINAFKKKADGTSERVKPEIKINIYLLIVANRSKYDEAMKAIAHVISFFQFQPSFDYAAIAGLEEREGRISFDLFSMTFEQQNHLWGLLGGKYMPSVMYKVGLMDIYDGQVEAEVPPVQEIWVNG